jgi:3'(2'), 5'-bisphosphate nucleotidase
VTTLTVTTLTDEELATTLARAAGRLLLAARLDGLLQGSDLKDAGDALAQSLLSRALAVHRPDDAVLSEEATDSEVRLTSARTWVIDPLDGTREYSEGRDDWAVHIALVEDGQPTASAVAVPARDVVFTTRPVPSTRAPGPLRMAASRSRAPQLVTDVAAALGAELVLMGSAGVKAMAVVTGEVDIYLHAGGQYEWDSCAPVGVARAQGLHTSRIDGSQLVYNRPDPSLPDLLICRPDLAQKILDLVEGCSS